MMLNRRMMINLSQTINIHDAHHIAIHARVVHNDAAATATSASAAATLVLVFVIVEQMVMLMSCADHHIVVVIVVVRWCSAIGAAVRVMMMMMVLLLLLLKVKLLELELMLELLFLLLELQLLLVVDGCLGGRGDFLLATMLLLGLWLLGLLTTGGGSCELGHQLMLGIGEIDQTGTGRCCCCSIG